MFILFLINDYVKDRNSDPLNLPKNTSFIILELVNVDKCNLSGISLNGPHPYMPGPVQATPLWKTHPFPYDTLTLVERRSSEQITLQVE